MEPKKNPNVDLEKKRGLYIQIGLALALLLVLGAFEYRSYEKGISSLGDFDMEADWEEEIENTFREEKPLELKGNIPEKGEVLVYKPYTLSK